MVWLLAGVGLLVLTYALAGLFVRADAAKIAQSVTRFGGVAAIGLGLLLSLRGAVAIGAPLALFGFSMLRRRSGVAGGSDRSAVETQTVRMTLERSTGLMDGEVLEGPYAGARLSELSRAQVEEVLAHAVRGDPDAAALLRAYLSRRNEGGGDDEGFDAGEAGGGQARGGAFGPMTPDEARDILGVGPGATRAQIKAAHKRLMLVAHPDRGGSDALAAQINRAKDVLLGR